MRKVINALGVAFFMLISAYTYAQQVATNESLSATQDENSIAYLDDATYNVRVFPNPSSQFVNVRSEDLVGKSFIVMDLTGKAVAAAQTMTDNLITIDVSNYPSGLYFIKYEDGTLVRFIVKQ